MAGTKGRPGYADSTITITTDLTNYNGGGVNGNTTGTNYTFAVSERNIGLERDRNDTTDSQYKEGVGGTLGKRVKISGFFKGDTPPNAAQQEYVKITASVVFDFIGVIMVERFEETGNVGDAVKWTLEGMTDGAFTST